MDLTLVNEPPLNPAIFYENFDLQTDAGAYHELKHYFDNAGSETKQSSRVIESYDNCHCYPIEVIWKKIAAFVYWVATAIFEALCCGNKVKRPTDIELIMKAFDQICAFLGLSEITDKNCFSYLRDNSSKSLQQIFQESIEMEGVYSCMLIVCRWLLLSYLRKTIDQLPVFLLDASNEVNALKERTQKLENKEQEALTKGCFGSGKELLDKTKNILSKIDIIIEKFGIQTGNQLYNNAFVSAAKKWMKQSYQKLPEEFA